MNKETDPVEVVVKTTGEVVGYACGGCGVLWQALATMPGDRDADALRQARRDARRCCNRTCEGCDGPVEHRNYLWCSSCLLAREQAKDAADFAKATKIPAAEYKGWVCWGDEFFPSVDELRDRYTTKGRDVPPFVWACSPHGFAMDADNVLDSALDEHHEDARDWLVDVEGFREFIDAWTAKQTLVSYFEDRSHAVVMGGAS